MKSKRYSDAQIMGILKQAEVVYQSRSFAANMVIGRITPAMKLKLAA